MALYSINFGGEGGNLVGIVQLESEPNNSTDHHHANEVHGSINDNYIDDLLLFYSCS